MKNVILFFGATLFFISSLWASDSSDVELHQWALSKEWRKLLHYNKNIWGTPRSLLDGPGFFFAKKGRTDALAELKATIAAMQDTTKLIGKVPMPAQCSFPARLRFLKDRLKLTFPPVACPKLDEFMATFSEPETVSVVFSSAYPNNPASMFGHSFLKINSKKKANLRDIGINFAAAVADDENGFAFMYFGVAGGYRGQWSTENYYDKVKDYVLAENRDLWEYELNISADETKKLLFHFWELENNSYFDYYFFDENCSYQILAALEAIKPEWNLTPHGIYFAPGESIKNLFTSPDIVKDVHLRPSLQRQVFQKYDPLNKQERKEFKALINGDSVKSDSPLVLEAAISYYEFMNVKKKGRLTEAEKTQQRTVLLQRAALGPQPEVQKRLKPIEAETRPDLGHDSYMLSLGQTMRQRADRYGAGTTTNLRIKSSYHDLMNNDSGYKRYSQMDFPSAEIQYDSDLQTVRLNEINAVHVTSLPPMNFLSKAPAWQVDSGLTTARDYGCLNCRHLFLELGLGAAFNFISTKNIFYAMANARSELYNKLDRGYRYGPGFETGALFNPFEKVKFRLTFKQFWDVDQDERSRILQNYLGQMSYSLARNYEIRTTINFIYPLDHPELRNTNATLDFIYFFN